jgi:hypothetical protein
MIDLEDLKKTVDNRFWKKAAKLQFEDAGNREEALQHLCKQINNGEYSPGSPVIIMELDKGYGIVRHIPVFNMSDYCVYYYCVKKLDATLSKRRVTNTYGGWSLGGRIRELEDDEDSYDSGYELSFSYNPKAWSKYYGEFNSKLYAQLIQHLPETHYRAVEFDLANYYDSIRLDILERLIRSDSDFQDTEVLNLLFYFLNYRDRKLSNYSPQYVGLPQDAIGDCSRLLANYYIQNYDKFMQDLLGTNEGSYFRFADDQYIFCKENDIKRLMQAASRKLFEIGLNINQLKVKVWKVEELLEDHSFEIFDILARPDEGNLSNKLNAFAEKVFNINEPDKLKNRGFPLLRRLVTFDFNQLRPDFRTQLMERVLNKDFTYSSKAYVLVKIYSRLREDEKQDYLAFLKECSDGSSHNAFHYELMEFAEKTNLLEVKDYAIRRIRKLNKARSNV